VPFRLFIFCVPVMCNNIMKYRVKVSDMFATLEDLNSKLDINSAWKLIERLSTFQPKTVKVIMN
jgi:hypothetical protein